VYESVFGGWDRSKNSINLDFERVYESVFGGWDRSKNSINLDFERVARQKLYLQ
jgi:hypothetical protein